MRFSSKWWLVAAATLALAACDDSSSGDSSDAARQRPDENDGNLLTLSGAAMPAAPSWAGAYLAARVAQSHFDWPRAAGFLDTVRRYRSEDETLRRRLMLLSLGNGDFDTALKLAQGASNEKDSAGLVEMIRVLAAIRDKQYRVARDQLDHVAGSLVLNFARLPLQAWLDAGLNQGDPKILAGKPEYVLHRVLLADYLGEMRDAPSVMELSTALTRLPALHIERLGDVFLRRQQYDLARLAYQALQKVSPNSPFLAERLAATQKKELPPLQVPLTPRVADVEEGLSIVIFDLATTFYNDQSDETALLFARMSLVLRSTDEGARLLLANVLARNGQLDAAIGLYRQISPNNPRAAQIGQQIAELLFTQDRDVEALATLQDLLSRAMEPAQKVSYLMQIGDMYRSREDFSKALAQYDAARAALGGKVGPENWDLLYVRGMVLERLKRWPEAEKDLLQALAYRPEHPYLLNYIGYSWADQGIHLDRAMELLLKAVQKMPQDGSITDSVGWAYYRQNKFPEAVQFLERAVELLPHDSTVNDHLGDAYASIGRRREAQFQWRRALNYATDPAEKERIAQKLDKA